MQENAEEAVIVKQQAVLETFFNLLGGFAFDKAKEFLEREKETALKNHTIAPFFSSAISTFSQLATTEKIYSSFMFIGPKGFLRKDSPLRSMYETAVLEYQRLEDKHYITPVTTPTISPTSSCRTPSPVLPSSSPSISVCSEVSVSGASSLSIGSSVQSSGHNLVPMYLGEDILENLASHLCGQLVNFICARQKTMELYERMYSMSSSPAMKFEELLYTISDIVKSNSKLFHHPLLSPLKSSFSYECEILMKLLEAEIHMQKWRFVPSLLCLHEAHSKLGAWISMAKEVKKLSVSYRTPPTPQIYTWLCSLKAALVSKFSFYFHDILSKQTTPLEMKSFCSKTSIDYFLKIVTFQKRYDAMCVALVLDTNGLEEYHGHGYSYPNKHYDPPKGLDSFPPVVCYPPNCFSQDKHASHWPSVVMVMHSKEQERNTDAPVLFFDPRMNFTYFMNKVEPHMKLVVIFETKKTDRDTHIHRFLQSMTTQLRGNKIFSNLKPGSK